jgi:hypothetical protein
MLHVRATLTGTCVERLLDLTRNMLCSYVLEVEDKVSVLDEDLRMNLGIDKVLDGFRTLIQYCRQLLQIYMFHDVQDEFVKFFTKEWFASCSTNIWCNASVTNQCHST